MRKLFALSALIPVILLCSCSLNNKPAEICVNRVFNAEMNIQFNETAYTADFTSNENGCNAVFSLPEMISGLGIAVNSGGITYSLDSLTFTAKSTPEQTLPIEAICLAISSIPETATKAEKVYTLCGRTKFGNYVMNIDAETFIPTFIEYDEAGITVRFINSA